MRLVTVAHGTRHGSGGGVAVELTGLAGERLGMPARTAYIELQQPLLADVLADGAASVLVPLLLSTGYHVVHDVPAVAEAAPAPVLTAAPLGPDPLLAAAQADRLTAAGARPGQPVVLVAAGSTDPAATADLEEAVRLLAEEWAGPVRLATLSGLGERVGQVVRPGDVVSPYLLSPGYFATSAGDLARGAGATVVASWIGAHPLVVDVVVRRVRDALGSGGSA